MPPPTMSPTTKMSSIAGVTARLSAVVLAVCVSHERPCTREPHTYSHGMRARCRLRPVAPARRPGRRRARRGASTPPCRRATPRRCGCASSSPRPTAPPGHAALDDQVAADVADDVGLAVDEGVHAAGRELERAQHVGGGVARAATRTRSVAGRRQLDPVVVVVDLDEHEDRDAGGDPLAARRRSAGRTAGSPTIRCQSALGVRRVGAARGRRTGGRRRARRRPPTGRRRRRRRGRRSRA